MDRKELDLMVPVLTNVHRRRSKKLVPDTAKDDVYWEKRKRNNLAAKKSRENKRHFELMVRGKVQALEEENALLKWELRLIRDRYNIPDEEVLMTSAERDKCLRDLMNNRTNTWLNDCGFPDSATSSISGSPSRYSDCSKTESCCEELECPTSNYASVVLALPLTREQTGLYRNSSSTSQRFQSEADGICDDSRQSDTRKRNYKASFYQDNMMPADLSMKKNPVCENMITSLSPRNGYHKSLVPDCQGEAYIRCNTRHSGQTPGNKWVNETRFPGYPHRNGDDRAINLTKHDVSDSEIKSKLRMVSEQVEHMQKHVNGNSNS